VTTATPTPDLLAEARGKVSPLEFWQMRVIRHTLRAGAWDDLRAWCQRSIGQRWIHCATGRLHQVHHLERVAQIGKGKSFILVSNHRSFFDLYVVTATLVRAGYPQRIVFPVRSNFFYDNPLGFLVNGAMSFFAMYPPLFRDKGLRGLNLLALEELARLLSERPTLVGIHPEGRRNRDGDPYELLPAQSGVGRLIHLAQVPVVPVFTNGLLTDDLMTQVRSNFEGSGTPIHTVFGHPIDFSDLAREKVGHSLFRQISERCVTAITALGVEERALRAAHERNYSANNAAMDNAAGAV
jgi:1-acyl-sn-glycerol-3-phosphate acyltransferase